MIEKIKKLYFFAVARDENISLEDRLILNAVLVGILTTIVGSTMNSILTTSVTAVVVPFILGAILLILYYFFRFKKIIKPFIVPIIFISISGISTIWVFNGGINSSNVFVAFVILILLLIISPPNLKFFVLVLFLAFHIGIYLIQLYRPDLIVDFPTEKERWIDHVITLFYTSTFIYLIIKFLHTNYTQERMKVEENEKKLKELIASKDMLLSILAHDLKSPFNALLGLTELLKNNVHTYTPEKLEKTATHIHSSAFASYNLLEDLLTWARAQSGKIPFEVSNLLLNEVCRDIINEMKNNAEAKNIHLEHKISSDLVVYADLNLLKIILRNLVSNAVKFTRNHGSITISAVSGNNMVEISVQDDGIGIPKSNLEKLFNPAIIYSSHGTSNEKGTGLGLLICKEFIEKHGGKLNIESEEGVGSRFYFQLPLPEKIN
ncbi:MAG: hypothetical protein H6538_05025 [Bacteroidales bacterium]|nr:hypothetical protein [Bacteroidales bacterium]MCB8998860.1 hypothetical protein [Bacteroidales bacterium]MCB9014001.1 hypothetical protein [Bacteroidales bacterium]